MPADNSIYNLVTILHNKMKGVAAYEEYQSDFEDKESLSQLLEDIKESDEQFVEKLQQELVKLLQGEGEGQDENQSESSEEENEIAVSARSEGRTPQKSAKNQRR